jgi:hypothetical protein
MALCASAIATDRSGVFQNSAQVSLKKLAKIFEDFCDTTCGKTRMGK